LSKPPDGNGDDARVPAPRPLRRLAGVGAGQAGQGQDPPEQVGRLDPAGPGNLSLRIRNLDTDVLKVNDANGNPIEISAVITWQVTDAAQALFDVEDYQGFVDIQAETAVRHVASVFPYDSYEEGQESLRGAAERVIATLQADLQERLDVAGVTVFDTRLRRLAYAPEIAADMLRRQQADAIVAARQRIVEGAVGMVDHALSSLSERDIVDLDEECKAAMVSNLMVVLVSDRGAQPVVNSGSLYT
jgi:hypothetical protein